MAKTLSSSRRQPNAHNGFALRFKKWTVVISLLAAPVSTFDLREAGPGDSGFRPQVCNLVHYLPHHLPKLNNVGEAFRRNGYQFPSNEDILVKEDPVKLGTDAYKDMFPNSIWPSTLPSIPPVSIFTLSSTTVNVTPHGQLANASLDFPSDIELIGAGTFGPNISGL